MKPYRKRVADDILKRKLEVMGAVLIEGPKWCGKTTTAEQCAGSILYMADPLEEQRNMSLFEVNPRALLAGKTPRLIDEWQIVPRLWDVVRFEVDHRDDLGQFILTGSAVPPSLDSIKHTGTGRIARMTMRPMSLFESGDSTGDVSLLSLFDNSNSMMGESNLILEDIAFLICRGGWPKAVGMDKRRVLDLAIEYYTAVV
jgi:predicted AAA+ superfamily ATPase